MEAVIKGDIHETVTILQEIFTHEPLCITTLKGDRSPAIMWAINNFDFAPVPLLSPFGSIPKV